MLTGNAETLPLIEPIVPDVYDVVRDAALRLSSVLVLERKLTVQPLSSGLRLLQGVSEREGVLLLDRSPFVALTPQTCGVLVQHHDFAALPSAAITQRRVFRF